MMNRKVKEIMTTDVITTTSDVDVVFAFEKLMENKISSLPVVENDKLIGIITATDVGHNLILDKYELGIIINALNELRTKLIQEQRDTDAVDEVLLKALDAPEKKRYFHRDHFAEGR